MKRKSLKKKKKNFKSISESKEEVIEFRKQKPKNKKKTLSFFEISVFQKQRKHFSSLYIFVGGEGLKLLTFLQLLVSFEV